MRTGISCLATEAVIARRWMHDHFLKSDSLPAGQLIAMKIGTVETSQI